MGHAWRLGHDSFPAALLLPVVPIRQRRPGHDALLPALRYLLQIRRRGGLLLSMVLLLRVLRRLLMLPMIWRRGGLLPVTISNSSNAYCHTNKCVL
jgi:hypothetical protein